jgi:hypothetical protein
MKMNQHLGLWLVALFCLVGIEKVSAQNSGTSLESEPATIKASVSVSAVQVAEPFLLEIQCVAPVGTRVNFPAVSEKLDEFDVINHRDAFEIPLETDSKQRSWTRQMTLESIVTGDLTVPAIEVQISDGAGTRRLASNRLDVKVLSLLEDRPDPKNFRDVKPLVDIEIEPVSSYAWVGWLAGGLAGGLFFAGALIAVVRHKRFITPLQWANEEFDQLEQSFASSRRTGAAISEQVSNELSLIVREFLEMQLEVSASNQTTVELLTAINTTGVVDEQTAEQIHQLFALADQAKYGGLALSETQLETAINEGRRLVHQIATQITPALSAEENGI